MGISNSKSSKGKKKGGTVGRRLQGTTNIYTAIEDVLGWGCGDESLLLTTAQPTLADCAAEALTQAGDVAGYQFLGGVCYKYDKTCFSGARPKTIETNGVTVSRGNLWVFYEATPGYLAYQEEEAWRDVDDYTVDGVSFTPGTLFIRLDADKNGLVDEEEVKDMALVLGNVGSSGFAFKGAFLSENSYRSMTTDALFDCRMPKEHLDFGEISDSLLDTTAECFSTGDAASLHVKHSRQQILYGFLGFALPDCPAVDFPSPPPSAPPAPCQPFDLAVPLAKVPCGPYEESYAPPYGSPDEIVTLSIDATLSREAAYAQCLTECCEQTTNDVHGLYYLDDPCSGALFNFATHSCTLYKGEVTLLPGSTSEAAPAYMTALTLPLDSKPYESDEARRSLNDPSDDVDEDEDDEQEVEADDASAETLEEPLLEPPETPPLLAAVAHNDSDSEAGPLSFYLPAAHRALHGAAALGGAPAHGVDYGSALNLTLALAPLVALLVGGLLGGKRRRAAKQ